MQLDSQEAAYFRPERRVNTFRSGNLQERHIMRKNVLAIGGVAAIAAISTTAIIFGATAQAAPAHANAKTDAKTDAALSACLSDDVSIYFGGQSTAAGVHRFDVTLVSRDGKSCTIPTQPQITLTQPSGATPVTVSAAGDDTPLVVDAAHQYHTSVAYSSISVSGSEIPVSLLEFNLANDPANSSYLGELMPWPGGPTGGWVDFTAWQAGVGLDASQTDAG